MNREANLAYWRLWWQLLERLRELHADVPSVQRALGKVLRTENDTAQAVSRNRTAINP